MAREKKRLGDMLIAEHIISQEQLEAALKKASQEHKKIGEVLVEQGYATEEAIAKAVSRQLDIEVVSLKGIEIDESVLKLADGKILKKHTMIPFAFSKNNMNIVKVAMADPMDMIAIDDFSIVVDPAYLGTYVCTREFSAPDEQNEEKSAHLDIDIAMLELEFENL